MTLGLSEPDHNLSVVVVDASGRVLWGAGEERFSRLKNHGRTFAPAEAGVPRRCLEAIDQAGLRPSRVVAAGLAGLPHFAREFAFRARSGFPAALRACVRPSWGYDPLLWALVLDPEDSRHYYPDARPRIFRERGTPIRTRYDHHACHAASGYYIGGQPGALVLTIDHQGDSMSASLWQPDRGHLVSLRRWWWDEQLSAREYEITTALLGFDPHHHAGKVTGLAGGGTRDPAAIARLRAFVRSRARTWKSTLTDAERGELRALRASSFRDWSDATVARAAQELLEEDVTRLIQAEVPDPARHHLVLAGGLFANVSLNFRISRLGFRSVFVAPAMDDGGTALGAAFLDVARQGRLEVGRLEDLYWGPGYRDEDLGAALDAAGLRHTRPGDIAADVANLLADGKVVARFDGRMEFGPRALGHRSILASPADVQVVGRLNRALRRSGFMPFAPSVLAEEADRLFHHIGPLRESARFMTVALPCTEAMAEEAPAVVHTDGTARPQLVGPEDDPTYRRILELHYKATGVRCVLNTSFNMHEEPIVATPEDAIRSFQRCGVDALAVGPYLVKAAA